MKGIIYLIRHKELDIVYIGSTIQIFGDRWKQHQYMCGDCSIQSYFLEYGIENFVCEIVKEYEVVNRKHLYVYEQLHMFKAKKKSNCINIREPSHGIIPQTANAKYYNWNRTYKAKCIFRELPFYLDNFT